MMKTIVVVVAVLALCIIVSEARPPKGPGSGESRKGGDRKHGDRPLKHGVKFCKALVNGNITNDNQTFDNVFSVVNTTCVELLEYLAQNYSAPENTTERTKRRAKSGRKGPRGKKNSSDSDESESIESAESESIEGAESESSGSEGSQSREGRQGDGESEEQTSIENLLHFCGGVGKSVPTGTSPDLEVILDKFVPPCTTACVLAEGVDCADEEA
ncbi:uncharacterized protein LOC128238887 [Mya arenaria]|uniref:uncharacterized protein LOC128238887 n=1 Tax=Mya arenaria TaxID=6604 RepID=UPI0022E18128|nr:uncharacterized protein LOC128238887 [Mya arenaria]